MQLQKTHQGFTQGNKVVLGLPSGPCQALVAGVSTKGLAVIKMKPLANAINLAVKNA